MSLEGYWKKEKWEYEPLACQLFPVKKISRRKKYRPVAKKDREVGRKPLTWLRLLGDSNTRQLSLELNATLTDPGATRCWEKLGTDGRRNASVCVAPNAPVGVLIVSYRYVHESVASSALRAALPQQMARSLRSECEWSRECTDALDFWLGNEDGKKHGWTKSSFFRKSENQTDSIVAVDENVTIVSNDSTNDISIPNCTFFSPGSHSPGLISSELKHLPTVRYSQCRHCHQGT